MVFLTSPSAGTTLEFRRLYSCTAPSSHQASWLHRSLQSRKLAFGNGYTFSAPALWASSHTHLRCRAPKNLEKHHRWPSTTVIFARLARSRVVVLHNPPAWAPQPCSGGVTLGGATFLVCLPNNFQSLWTKKPNSARVGLSSLGLSRVHPPHPGRGDKENWNSAGMHRPNPGSFLVWVSVMVGNRGSKAKKRNPGSSIVWQPVILEYSLMKISENLENLKI